MKDVALSVRNKIETSEARCDKPLWNHAKLLLEQRLEAMPPKDKQEFEKFKVSNDLCPIKESERHLRPYF